MNLLYSRMQNERPWKITEEFIGDLGMSFLMFKTMNSFYLSKMEEVWDAGES